MSKSKLPDQPHSPGPTRVRVLAASERLLRQGKPEFSMRELAAEAGVSFATPFNQFGSKAAIMQALSAERIDRMTERFRAAAPTGDAADRVLEAVSIAVGVLLEEADVNRVVIGSLGSPSATPGAVRTHSRELWALALGDLEGVAKTMRPLAQKHLAGQLALAFRGCISFWAAGEIADEDLAGEARRAAAMVLLAVADRDHRTALLDVALGA